MFTGDFGKHARHPPRKRDSCAAARADTAVRPYAEDLSTMPNQCLSDDKSNIETTSVMGQLIPRNVTPKSKDSYQHDSTGGHGGIFHSVYFGAIKHRQTYRRVAGWNVERVVREPKVRPAINVKEKCLPATSANTRGIHSASVIPTRQDGRTQRNIPFSRFRSDQPPINVPTRSGVEC